MSWQEVTWDDADGAAPFITALSAALEAHPAWEFVEETVEKMTVSGGDPAVWYDMLTFPFQVWRNSGIANGSGKDFYLAFARTIQGYPDTVEVGEGGYIPVFGATDYDETTHTASGVLGKSTWQSITLTADGKIEGTDGYPWLQAKVETGGTTWGYWGAPNQEPTEYDELNHPSRGTQHPMSQTSGRTYSVPTFGPSDTPPTTTRTALIRVTERGIFFVFRSSEETDWVCPHYVGLYEFEGVPAELSMETPLIQMGPDEYAWGSTGSQVSLVSLPQLIQGRRSDSTGIGQWFATPDYYQFSYDSNLDVATEREKFPAPGVEPYIVLPIGLGPTSESGFDISMPLYTIPGIWTINKSDQTPTGWTNDGTTTITSPDGHECAIYLMADQWFVIDKEMS